MKFTIEQLRQIISEELISLSEVDNNQVMVQSAQHLADRAQSAKEQSNQANNIDPKAALGEIMRLLKEVGGHILVLDPGHREALNSLVSGMCTEIEDLNRKFEEIN